MIIILIHLFILNKPAAKVGTVAIPQIIPTEVTMSETL